MNTTPYEALTAAATDGVDFDGLVVEREREQLVVSTPTTEVTAPVSTPRAALADVSDYVDNWFFWHQTAPQDQARWTFLRWLEGTDDRSVPDRYDALTGGLSRSWGQLELTVTLGSDGTRRYDLRHEADADTSLSALEQYTDPHDAREIAKRDGDGRYRPLKTAPTLRDGWVFPDLDATALLTAVGFIYPASIQNWHRERQGDLDISHWEETMARQTGIYGVIETWDRQDGHDHVEWVAEACCDDSQCLKRRVWEYDSSTPLETDGGSGAFPCREPCSIVISAARQWTKLEGEHSRTYEFDLTPSEKDQIEAIIDAVADGRVDEIREADVRTDANRLRTRFLRAKLFDDEGNLCGVPTDEQ